MKKITELLNAIIKKRRLKRMEVSQMCGLSNSEVSQMLNGKIGISEKKLEKFCAGLEIEFVITLVEKPQRAISVCQKL